MQEVLKMGIDFTSRSYPYMTSLMDEAVSLESHKEPAAEDVKSAVQGFEHPLFSSTGLVGIANSLRSLSNSIEPKLSGKVQDKTIKDMVKACYSTKFPVDILMVAADLEKALPDRNDMGDASTIIQKLTTYANGFGRPPKNFEIFMAHAVEGVGAAQKLLDKAKSAPNEKASPVGSKHDDKIFYKKKNDEKVLRTNKEVVQWFMKRMMNGSHFFPHLPLGTNVNAMPAASSITSGISSLQGVLDQISGGLGDIQNILQSLPSGLGVSTLLNALPEGFDIIDGLISKLDDVQTVIDVLTNLPSNININVALQGLSPSIDLTAVYSRLPSSLQQLVTISI